ncbi:hypothetical protein EUTSA_v10001157mg [Eutrema salsugineum]|uniref:KIB1-4 beta-propeller domain-containing protein n=1 Tax=Eutrema salsugineum TaxID=72664 RepID=V4L7X6_EUTSA|nr:uncharacterized protein LOC18016262 [Eutrema salsugineum]ESQ39749.1 hypothetical protein EUTSA_v10001157mg [Eutrema salsugineum]
MSQLLSRILKPIVYKNVLRHNKNIVRWCSSKPHYPFLLIDHIPKVGVGDSSDGRLEIRSDCDSNKEVLIKDEDLAEEVVEAMNNEFITYDHLFFMEKFEHLPRLPNGSQIQNIAMSCRPGLNNEDWVAAVEFSGSHQLRFYRHKDPRWIDIETTHESVSPYSSLMYSKKDQRFYVPTPGCSYLCSFDLNFKEKDKPEFIEVRKNYLPKNGDEFYMYDLAEMNFSTRTHHFVESPSGEQFLISWYYEDDAEVDRGKLNLKIFHKTKKFKVFREDTKLSDRRRKFMSYTEDIGDLCIFLGRDEPLCVPASSSPGLKPNCIYFVGYNYGVYDITENFCTFFEGKDLKLRSLRDPYWPHPLSLTPY